MALFGFGKNKEEKRQAPACACHDGRAVPGGTKGPGDCFHSAKDGIYCIKVLGSGCASCHTLLEHTETAVKNMGLSIPVEYITDMKKIMEYGVMSVPALVVNEEIVSMGKVLRPDDIERLLRKSGL